MKAMNWESRSLLFSNINHLISQILKIQRIFRPRTKYNHLTILLNHRLKFKPKTDYSIPHNLIQSVQIKAIILDKHP